MGTCPLRYLYIRLVLVLTRNLDVKMQKPRVETSESEASSEEEGDPMSGQEAEGVSKIGDLETEDTQISLAASRKQAKETARLAKQARERARTVAKREAYLEKRRIEKGVSDSSAEEEGDDVLDDDQLEDLQLSQIASWQQVEVVEEGTMPLSEVQDTEVDENPLIARDKKKKKMQSYHAKAAAEEEEDATSQEADGDVVADEGDEGDVLEDTSEDTGPKASSFNVFRSAALPGTGSDTCTLVFVSIELAKAEGVSLSFFSCICSESVRSCFAALFCTPSLIYIIFMNVS